MHGYTFISPSVSSVCSPPTLSIMLASSAHPVWLDEELENWFDLELGKRAGREKNKGVGGKEEEETEKDD